MVTSLTLGNYLIMVIWLATDVHVKFSSALVIPMFNLSTHKTTLHIRCGLVAVQSNIYHKGPLGRREP